MSNISTIKLKPLIISLILSLGTGFLSSLLTRTSREVYANLIKPDLAPPAIVFPIVWTILFILMGISAYIVYESNSPYKEYSLKLYIVQLIVNFFWSIIFFNLNQFTFAFIWILVLIVLVSFMIFNFYKINKCAAYLQIPYLLWLIFAAYLNYNIILLNI